MVEANTDYAGTMTQPWATTYRPRTFEQVVGQPEKAHLRAVLRQGNGLPPLLVLRGPSGTGKTTVARIIAAALNCHNLGPKGDPCGTCPACSAIHEGSFSGVYEHNAALRNGAEHMRELQERAYLQPDGNYSVFILDEAQTLSGQAWKVLLKLFEEPPPGTVFILVTSEPNKIPRTIQTRAVQYEFGKVPAAEVKQFVEGVLTAESAAIEGLDLIVDLADGSVREALTLAEQCVRSGASSAYELFGTRDLSLDLLEGLVSNDKGKSLKALDQMWRGSGHAVSIFEQIAEQLQNVLYRHHGLKVFSSPETERRIDLVVRQLGEDHITKLLTTMALWQPRVRNKAHLLFMWQEMSSQLHGSTRSTPNKTAPVMKAAPVRRVSADDIASSLSGLDLG